MKRALYNLHNIYMMARGASGAPVNLNAKDKKWPDIENVGKCDILQWDMHKISGQPELKINVLRCKDKLWDYRGWNINMGDNKKLKSIRDMLDVNTTDDMQASWVRASYDNLVGRICRVSATPIMSLPENIGVFGGDSNMVLVDKMTGFFDGNYSIHDVLFNNNETKYICTRFNTSQKKFWISDYHGIAQMPHNTADYVAMGAMIHAADMARSGKVSVQRINDFILGELVARVK